MVVSSRSLALFARGRLCSLALGLAGVFLLSVGGAPVSAATSTTLPCATSNLEGDTSGYSLDCQVLDADNDKAEVLNAQSAFTLDDWVFASKYEIDENKYETGVSGLGFGIDGDDEGGAFSFDDGLWTEWSSAVILFKSANRKAKKKDGDDGLGNVVMFLIQPGQTFGSFAQSYAGHGISHISLYLSKSDPFGGDAVQPVPTPLPAAGWMLIAGVAGLGGLRARRMRKSR